ncbi:hypothetical protein AYI70_g8653 [Smittium culicis]|uniref:RNA-directed DNA polymerase from mobile element jockey n=1 Tax=Smittium culicis TaxID=133412 RepID=A0A1R1XEZ5_9FUNG|nr:hypothetical protein AYI70_g8653 [Smittium culicis]
MYDSGEIPSCMTTSIIVPVPKKGVDVSELPNRIPGLLFAEDAVVLADSAENLQTSLDAISAWSDAWTADNYAYLGYIMNSKWGVSGTIKNNKLKAQKVLYSAYGFLNRSNVLAALKIKFINSALLPIGCYGGETFGMSEARCHPIQTVIDQATRLVANVGKSAAMERIREELGITSVFLRTSIARERATIKWPASKTWISDLINKPIKAQKSTWPENKIQRQLDWPASNIPHTDSGPPGRRENANGQLLDCPTPIQHQNN